VVAGLLFVAVSLAPERLTGAQASEQQRTVAATAFTALLDGMWISLFGLRPGNELPRASLVLGLLGAASTVALIVRLYRVRSRERLSRRWPFLMAFIVVLYGAQVVTAFTASSAVQAPSTAATLVMVLFGVGIARSWERLGLRRGGPTTELAAHARQVIRHAGVGRLAQDDAG
jgi:FtsH-binding integral membrane protein